MQPAEFNTEELIDRNSIKVDGISHNNAFQHGQGRLFN